MRLVECQQQRRRRLGYCPHQAGTVVVNAAGTDMQVYVAKEAFARKQSLLTWHDDKFGGWYLGPISQGRAAA